jgi:hypothetical protein
MGEKEDPVEEAVMAIGSWIEELDEIERKLRLPSSS